MKFLSFLLPAAALCVLFQSSGPSTIDPMIFALRVSKNEVPTLPTQAQWMVSLHDADGQLLVQFPFKANAHVQRCILPPQKKGIYTASFYLDLNGNHHLDKGFFGQPTEPYAFSNEARGMFSAPSLEDKRFLFDGQEIPVLLQYHFK